MNTIQHDSATERFSTTVEGCEAILAYRLADGVMNITHTGVPEPISGRGIAAQLMWAAVAAANEAGWRINPLCSYAAAFLRRHPEARCRQLRTN